MGVWVVLLAVNNVVIKYHNLVVNINVVKRLISNIYFYAAKWYIFILIAKLYRFCSKNYDHYKDLSMRVYLSHSYIPIRDKNKSIIATQLFNVKPKIWRSLSSWYIFVVSRYVIMEFLVYYRSSDSCEYISLIKRKLMI